MQSGGECEYVCEEIRETSHERDGMDWSSESDESKVHSLVVLSQLPAMIGRENRDSAVGQSQHVQLVQNFSYQMIGKRHCGVVAPSRESGYVI
jgi:hypothetical protein